MSYTTCRSPEGNAANEYNVIWQKDRAGLVNRIMSALHGDIYYGSDEFDALMNNRALHKQFGDIDRAHELLNSLENALVIASQIKLSRCDGNGIARVHIQYDGETLRDHVRGAVRMNAARQFVEDGKDRKLNFIRNFINRPQDFGVSIGIKWTKTKSGMKAEVVDATTIGKNMWAALLKKQAGKIAAALETRFEADAKSWQRVRK